MPIALIDPATPAAGSLPPSPLGQAFAGLVGARRVPTAEEIAHAQYLQSEVAKNQQQLGAAQELADVFGSIYTPKPGAAVTNPDGTPGAAPPASTDDLLKTNTPAFIKAVADAGKYSDIPALYRMMTANAPGVTTKGANGQPSPVDMAMLGAGDNYTSTIGGMREHEKLDTQRQIAVERVRNALGNTAEQKNRRNKINELMTNQGIGYPDAEALVDGVAKTQIDPISGRMYLVNEATGTRKMIGDASAAPAAAPAAPGGDQPDYLTQLTTPQPGGTGAPGGPVVLSTDTPAARPAMPTATAKDLKVNFNNAYGGGATVGRLLDAISAATGGETSGGPATALGDINNMKSQYLAIAGLRPGLRNNAAAQGLVTNQLPPSNPGLDPEDLFKQTTTSPEGARAQSLQAMNNIMQWRLEDEKLLGSPDTPKEERIAAQNRVDSADKFMGSFASPELLAQYQAAAGIPVKAAADKAAGKPTNQQQMKSATSTATSMQQIPLGKTGKPAPRSEAEYNLIPAGALYEYTDGSIRTKGGK